MVKHSVLLFIVVDVLIIALVVFIYPYLESYAKITIFFVTIPFLLFLLYNFLKRYHFLLRGYRINNPEEPKNNIINQPNRVEITAKGNQIINFKGTFYNFTQFNLFLMPLGLFLSFISIFVFFDLQINQWFEEIVIKQAVYLINIVSNINAQALFNITWRDPWYIFISEEIEVVRINTLCTSIVVYAMLIGIFIFTPQTQIQPDKEEFYWRKVKTLNISIIITYSLNLIRIMLSIIVFYYLDSAQLVFLIIDSIYSVLITVLIAFLLFKWLPEFSISLYSLFLLISKMIKNYFER